ncbi:MAG: CDP-alcohol phosphatidyltransferase family protein [Proteobacteria bacterium]|nr:MAG: CDP-alcohol phosphatidyltransferase family protein [Pseudomonadota bacterium]
MTELNFNWAAIVTLPNVVSLSRVAAIPVMAWAMLDDRGALALGLFGLVVISDTLDGFIARRMQQTTTLGTLFDHGADATFVLSVTALCAYLGLLPWFLPAVITVAFIQYVLDSHVLSGAQLRPSLIGRWNGISYFVVTGCAIFVHHYAQEAMVISLLRASGWLLVASTVISIGERAFELMRTRRFRARSLR